MKRSNFTKKVIRAAAGTGKTYRLSLEFLALLLKHTEQGMSFREILVITFTKKATAEIRERIFEHLGHILTNTQTGQEVKQNLAKVLDRPLSADDMENLHKIYREMRINKHLVQIQTIDGFTNFIFKTIIAPFIGLTQYSISTIDNERTYQELYAHILETPEFLQKLEKFFKRSGLKTIENYTKFIKSLLDNRWLFYLLGIISPAERRYRETGQPPDNRLFEDYVNVLKKILGRFQNYLDQTEKDLSPADILNKDACRLFIHAGESVNKGNICDFLADKLLDKNFILEHHKELFRVRTFWSKKKLLRKKADKPLEEEMQASVDAAFKKLADWLLIGQLLPEELEIRQMADIVYEKYDEIVFREKIFSYNDITFYTFKYLYDPELSLIDDVYVNNAFYEILSTNIRFILVDEFQDTSIIQYKILLPIIMEIISGEGAKEYGGVIVVGDEKQSIYGWRGGERDLLLRIPHMLRGPQELQLTTSYRSNERILSFINDLFSHEGFHQELGNRGIKWNYENVKGTGKNQGYVRIVFSKYGNSKTATDKTTCLRHFIKDILGYKTILSPQKTAILARFNNHLEDCAKLLDEYGENYVLESSNSIFLHRAIRPVLYLLHYIAWHDTLSLLKFLRSDLLLLPAKKLTKILGVVKNGHLSLQSCADIPEVEYIHRNFSPATVNHADILGLVKKILEFYNVPGIFNQENDIKNIHFFLEVIAGFCRSNRDFPVNVAGFLSYCREHEQDENMQQKGLQEVDAIKLLTFHKSKGLEFDNVFLLWDLSGMKGSDRGKLLSYFDYTDYFDINDFLLTFNFDHIIEHSSKADLPANKKVRQNIEEMNNFYVATTRARTNLFIYFLYRKSDGIEGLFRSRADSDRTDYVAAQTAFEIAKSQYAHAEQSDDKLVFETGRLEAQKSPREKKQEQDYSRIGDFMDIEKDRYLEPDIRRSELERHLDFKTVYLRNRNTDRGNVAHFYLSFIRIDTPEQRQYALEKTIAFYGTLFTREEIDHIVTKVNRFMEDNANLFSKTWSGIFTEHMVFGRYGQVRLDRLLVNKEKKEILVVDYKTGETYAKEQIFEYVESVRELPIVQMENYRVTGKFLEVDVE